jgi:hypothetical protein
MYVGYAIYFRFEAKLCDTEAKFFSLGSETEGIVSLVLLLSETEGSHAKQKGNERN